jgi:dolichol-phosphate mannosyltransferase/undecaprenyl-phosphate 4-deoxy-4-formamido-L-arabinose transferase
LLISIVIPVYKSSRTLIELSERTDRVFEDLEDTDYELLFVNDSPFWEETNKTLEILAREDPHVTAIQLTRNFGQQPATLCGIDHATGDYIVTMDDDLQHAPEDIPKLLDEASHDAVIASFRARKHPALKRITSKLKGYFDEIILDKPRSITLTAFRMIKAPIAKLMLKRNTPYPFIPALLFEITNDLVNVEVDHYPRADGNSHYTFGKMVKLFSNLIVNNSSLLLRAMGYTGFVIAFIAFIYALVIVFRSLFMGIAVAGWASTFSAILFFGGMTLLTLGIVGEYLVRIVATTEQRPTYYVREILKTPGGSKG